SRRSLGPGTNLWVRPNLVMTWNRRNQLIAPDALEAARKFAALTSATRNLTSPGPTASIAPPFLRVARAVVRARSAVIAGSRLIARRRLKAGLIKRTEGVARINARTGFVAATG